jgi:lactate dehydrogenase-like 2-hydroxyacid dehydrogenase
MDNALAIARSCHTLAEAARSSYVARAGQGRAMSLGERVTPTRLAFIGCGAMGAPIAERLIDAGHSLRVYDPDPQATAPLVERGAVAARCRDGL